MRHFWLLMVFGLMVFGLHAQTREELRVKKQKAEAEIEYTNRLIERSRNNEKASLNRLRLINNKISQRNKIISTLNTETSVIQEAVNDNSLVVELLNNDLADIRKEYAEMIKIAYKNRIAYNKIIFLLSSHDLNQAYKRHLYLKQYTNYRRKQALTIQAVQDILSSKLNDLDLQKQEKEKTLKEKENENKLLFSEKGQQDVYVKKIQREQRTLRKKLEEQQKAEEQLEKEIQRIIEEEARKLRASGEPGFNLTPEYRLAGSNFEQNKTLIPWPVKRGIITERFGVHPHPILKNITINNNGIDITTDPGSKARAVFNGEVSRVFGIVGGNMAVIIRHGAYLTVYSNLQEVFVKKGEKVTTGQDIGIVFSDSREADKTILKFQIWHESKKMNPENWIAK